LGPPLPDLNVDDLIDGEKRQQLVTALEQRIKKKEELREILINQSMIKVIYNIYIFINCFIFKKIVLIIFFLQVMTFDHK